MSSWFCCVGQIGEFRAFGNPRQHVAEAARERPRAGASGVGDQRAPARRQQERRRGEARGVEPGDERVGGLVDGERGRADAAEDHVIGVEAAAQRRLAAPRR